MKLLVDGNKFIISNQKDISKSKEDCIYLFGYCFLKDKIIKNRSITKSEFKYIKENRNSLGGIYVVVCNENNNITMIIDPLVQYNLYYFVKDNIITISNNLFEIANLHKLKKVNDNYIKDIRIKQNPMCGNTLVSDVMFFQYDDMYNPSFSKKNKRLLPLEHDNYKFLKMDNSFYKNYTYDQLVDTYIKKLKNRAEVISKSHDEVYISLTGGADSRLAASFFMKYDNIYHYCFGDGKREDRLISEYIINKFKLKPAKDVPVVGNGIGLYSKINKILKYIIDTSCNKPYCGLYINGYYGDNICNITGYYGANVCGSVGTGDMDIGQEPRYKNTLFYKNHYSKFDYIDKFKSEYLNLKNSNRSDLFYLNNRGRSHYACQSLADNLYGSNFDILIDPINIELVKKCPYKDAYINKCAITIDILYKVNKDLALTPYDNRVIPKYRSFDYIPSFNCFEKNKLDVNLNIKEFNYIRPKANERSFLNFKDETLDTVFTSNEFKTLREKYNYLLKECSVEVGPDSWGYYKMTKYMYAMFICSVYYLQNMKYKKY